MKGGSMKRGGKTSIGQPAQKNQVERKGGGPPGRVPGKGRGAPPSGTILPAKR